MKNDLHLTSLPRIITLMYHRIDETDTDPWDICVSPQHFDEQVQFVKNNYNIISVKDVIEAVSTGNIIDNSICITFDDGYADNYFNAKPVLEKYNCPAAFFIPTNFMGSEKPFWWDELEMILLHSKQLPNHLSLHIDGAIKKYYFDEKELSTKQWQQHKNWKWYETPPTNRCAAFLNIWQMLRPLSYVEIEKQMQVIRNWAGKNDDVFASRLPMNKQQLRTLADNDLFTMGLHTHTHPDLEGKTKAFQSAEMLLCKNVLADEYGIESNCLAFSYGRYDNDTIAAANELNLAGCLTTEAVSINVHSDLMKLGRYQVDDWNVNYFKEQLAGWMEQ